jgi:hypothetical protein
LCCLVRIFQNTRIGLEVLSNYEIDLISGEINKLSEHEMTTAPGVNNNQAPQATGTSVQESIVLFGTPLKHL